MIDTATYKTRIEEEKATLERELGTIGEPNASNPGTWEGIQRDTVLEADPNDQASELDEYQENRAIVDALNPRYQEVTAALDRIKQGTYGICSVCGSAIEEDRLDADPAAQTCKAHLDS